MKKITLTCVHCGSSFDRELKEYTRNVKRGRKVFCNNSCKASWYNANQHPNPNGFKENLLIGSESDIYSPFRWYLRVTKQRKSQTNNLTLEYLKRIWDSQGGVCPYTGIHMVLEPTSEGNHNSLYHASLDRVDSSLGYVEGNVEFVCNFINYAKNKFSKDEVNEFLGRIKKKS